MREKNENSDTRQYIDLHGVETKFNPKVKGVGSFGSAQGRQEGTTHTGNPNFKGDGQECPTHTELIEIRAVADDNSKRSGEAVEAAFLAKVCKLRIPVCKPWGDSERYDFVVDWGKGLWRVQVKGALYCERSRYQAGPGGKGKPFTKEDMDFVVVHIVPKELWYVVPIEMAEGLVKLWFNPRSTRARFEKYREAVFAGLSAEGAGAGGSSGAVPE
jgi:hypothetical protein